MAVLELDLECRVGQEFLHDTREFENVFLGHGLSIADWPAGGRRRPGGDMDPKGPDFKRILGGKD
jgi:hypothetical protein